MVRLTITGFDQMEKAGDEVINWKALFHKRVGEEIRTFGEAVVSRSKSQYLSGRPGLNVVTGRLRGSITSIVKEREDGYDLAIGTNVEYAPTHEFGNPARHIPQRAFLAPAVADELPAFRKTLEETLRQVTRKPFGE